MGMCDHVRGNCCPACQVTEFVCEFEECVVCGLRRECEGR